MLVREGLGLGQMVGWQGMAGSQERVWDARENCRGRRISPWADLAVRPRAIVVG